MWLKNSNDDPQSTYNRTAWVHFVLSGQPITTAARLAVTVHELSEATGGTVHFYGIADGAPGDVLNVDWDENTITGSNAPQELPFDTNPNLVHLGSTSPGLPGQELSIETDELGAFLQADTNGEVTILMTNASSGEVLFLSTRENPTGGAAFLEILPDNSAPYFIDNPIIGPDAKVNKEYNRTLAGTAIDPDQDDSLTYTLVEGPSWLTVTGDGALGGTPLPSDEGLNQFTVQVNDSVGNSDQTTLIVTVLLATEVSVVADTYIRGGGSADNNYGSESELTIKTESASYTRHAYLRFDYQSLGGGALEKVDLLVTPSAIGTDTGNVVLRARLLDDADDYWDEYSLTWNTAPAPSATEVSVNGPFQVGTEIELDVTSLLNQAGNTNGIATIVLDANNGSGSNRWLNLASREHADSNWHASLDIVTDAPVNIPPLASFTSSITGVTASFTDTSTDSDVSISIEKFPGNSVEKFPLSVLVYSVFISFFLCLNR